MIDKIIRLIKGERVDDIPVLLAQGQKMQVPALLDQFFPTPGHWKGELSFGEVVAVGLTFVASPGDHCLSHVQPWVEEHLDTLGASLDKGMRPLDCSDDRLAAMLDAFSEAETGGDFETALNGVVRRVYELESDRVRINSTSAKTYVGVSEDRLLQFGHSKDPRSDWSQVKMSLSALDPLGLPLTTTGVSGRCADDPVYVPEIQRVQQTLGAGGQTYLGDGKRGGAADARLGGREWRLFGVSLGRPTDARRGTGQAAVAGLQRRARTGTGLASGAGNASTPSADRRRLCGACRAGGRG